MTNPQELWWLQAKSDYELFERLRKVGASPCHLLHYLQMSTEKLSKAYLWRSGQAPPKTHVGFVKFLRSLIDRKSAELDAIAVLLTFKRASDFEAWVQRNLPLAYAVQNIAPAEAQDGPNPEYPWPHANPIDCPVRHSFQLWNQVIETGSGRKLLSFMEMAIRHFEQYA